MVLKAYQPVKGVFAMINVLTTDGHRCTRIMQMETIKGQSVSRDVRITDVTLRIGFEAGSPAEGAQGEAPSVVQCAELSKYLTA
jgi:hypothetical protein